MKNVLFLTATVLLVVVGFSTKGASDTKSPSYKILSGKTYIANNDDPNEKKRVAWISGQLDGYSGYDVAIKLTGPNGEVCHRTFDVIKGLELFAGPVAYNIPLDIKNKGIIDGKWIVDFVNNKGKTELLHRLYVTVDQKKLTWNKDGPVSASADTRRARR